MRVLAGIVLYNPDLQRLRQNVSAILPQVDGIVLVDNGSMRIGEIRDDLTRQGLDPQACLVENGRNLGIAAALFNMLGNYVGSGFAMKKGAVITKPLILLVLVLLLIKILQEM